MHSHFVQNYTIRWARFPGLSGQIGARSCPQYPWTAAVSCCMYVCMCMCVYVYVCVRACVGVCAGASAACARVPECNHDTANLQCKRYCTGPRIKGMQGSTAYINLYTLISRCVCMHAVINFTLCVCMLYYVTVLQ
jgi:hypothetical protein